MTVSRELKRRVRRCEPCLPRLAKEPPAGPGWIHEIKHDGFRILAELNAGGVKLITRKGFDLAQRFPLATAAIAALPARSCIVDGEAIACDANGLSVFDLLRYRRQDDAVTLCAFDLLELDGVDLRQEPIEVRKRTLSRLLRRKHAGISFNRHFGRGGGDCLPERLRARLRGHRLKAAGLTLSTGTPRLLDQGEKPSRAGHAAA
jgi:bifunctional non-homologous end joining protein LigD